MNPLIWTFLLSIIPISELRGAILYAIPAGINPFLAYIVAVTGNLLVIPLVYFFLNDLHHHFLRISLYEKIFNKYVERNRKKLERHVGTKFEFIALVFLVAIPLPITGAYTGTLLAWLFGLKKKKAYLAIGLGVLIAGIIMTIVTVMGVNSLTALAKAIF